MRIVIAGAGVGGLTAALFLHSFGFTDVRLLDTVLDIQPIGVGLNILPNAVRELDELGVADRLGEVAVATGSLSYYNRFGSLIHAEPRGRAAGYRWPQLSIHRGRLQTVLLDAVRDRLGADAVVPGHRVTGFTPLPDGRVGVAVTRADGTSRREVADVLVGADGIQSEVRDQLHPDDHGPRWNGLLVWRGSAWASPFLDGNTMIIAGDRTRRAVVYPMSMPGRPGEPVLMNWAVARHAGDRETPDRADWNRPVDPARFLDDFTDLAFDWLDIPALIRSSEQALEYPMVDRDPLPWWTCDRVTLLGDAAHAMYPMGSNGATQSIVDGRVLAESLAAHPDPAAALAAYEHARLPAMTRLQEAGRRRGPEIVIDIADERAPNGFTSVSEVISASELAGIAESYAALGAFDTETVNGGARW